jgi:hypothetical protein
MQDTNKNPEMPGSQNGVAARSWIKRCGTAVILFGLGFAGHRYFAVESLAGGGSLETVSLSSVERSGVPALVAHDPIANLSSLVGTYKLVQVGNKICGSLAEPEMTVKFFGTGKDLVFSLAGTDIRFMNIDAGWDIDPVYPQDKTVCSGERLAESTVGQLVAHEITKCKGKEISEGFSEISIINSRLVYRFHQSSSSPEMLNIPEFTCEWVKN